MSYATPKQDKRFTKKSLVGLVAAAVCMGMPAMASENMLEEVVVTATKRATSLDDISGGANVLGQDQLGAGGVESVRDMYVSVPNLSIGDQFGFARVFMRGIGMTSIDIGGEGAVSFLQDGAIIPRPAAQLTGMFDLDQVEVLRGPQGTLYGRGATAGAINLVTAKPGKEFGGYASLTLGNYGLTQFEGAVDIPMGDALALRVATKQDQRDGYGTNLVTGSEVDDRDAASYRATFAYDAGGSVRGSLSFQTYEEDDNNFAFHYFGPSAGTLGGVPPASLVLGGTTILDVKGDIYDLYSDQEPINKRDADNITLIVDADLSDNLSLRSVTSSQSLDRFLRDDLDSTDVNLFGRNDYTEESESFGQEFTLNYNGDAVSLLAGVMYFDEELYGNVYVPLTNICYLLAPALCGTPVGDAIGSGRYEQRGVVDIKAYAAFAEVTYEMNDQWSMIAGLRYNYEERDGTGFFKFDAAGLDLSTDQKEDWNDVTPRLTLEYRPNDDTLVYATFNQAFKSGVINTGSISPPLDPETVDAIEVGVKGTTTGSINYAVSAFLYDYQDLQISFVDATSTVSTINAAEAENYGLELELSGSLGGGLSFDMFATYLSAEYKDFVNGDYANGFAITRLDGNTLPNAPEYTAKLGLNYETSLTGGTLMLRGEVYYQDDIYFTEWNRPDATQEGYSLVNLKADYALNSEDWVFSAFVRNLADEEIISNNIITAPLYSSLRVGSLLPPRTFGVSASYQF
jgi:iron complex outermembrane receptor protein